MKILLCSLLALLTLTSTTKLTLDAPVEEFYIPAEKIHPRALEGVIGVMTITFVDLGYYTYIMNPPPAQIQGYQKKEGFSDSATLVLSLKNIRALSGIDYEQMIIRRFPVVAVDNNFYEIVYDLEKNLRIWVHTENQYVRTNIGQLVPMRMTWFSDQKNLFFGAELFYLMKGRPRKYYESPSLTANYFEVRNSNQLHDIPFRTVNETISDIEITEIAEGFAKVTTRSGADGEPQFTGWIKILENNILTIWPVAQGGC
jgi:hypothetical protein